MWYDRDSRAARKPGMTVLTAESILRDLEQYRLLPPENYARAEAAARRDDLPPARLVQFLTSNGLLTKFQADAIASGKAAGLVFGPYVLVERIGDGGMGVVYKARHARLERIDALKVIRSDKISSKVVARRFLREIRLTSSLQHPHIVRAYDAGTVGTQLYLATEYVRGRNLAAVVTQRGPLSVADACLVGYQTALALQHIHEHHLIHRDVKPSNLLRDEATGAVKLLDLGLGGVHHEEEEQSAAGALTRDGVILGTPDFMAPEQAQNPHGVDIRADLYGLGCTLFFLLTGRPPYEGTSVEKLFKHSFSPPPTLALPKGTAPPALVALVGRLMAKHPDDRYADPAAVVKAFLALRPGSEGSITHPAPRQVRDDEDGFENFGDGSLGDTPAPRSSLELPRKSRAWVYGLAAGVVASLVLLAVALGAFRSPKKPAESPAVTAAEEPGGELRDLRKAPANTPEERAAVRKRALDLRAKYPGTAMAVGAASVLRKLPSPLDTITATQEAFLGTSPGAWLAFSPSDDRLFVARADAGLEEWDVVTRRETGRYRGLEVHPDRPASVSSDGRVVVVVNDGKLVAGGAGRGRSFDLGEGLTPRSATVTPDGKSAAVVFESADERIALVDTETGRVGVRLDQSSIGVVSVVISPDGGTVAVIAADGVVRLFATSTGKKTNAFDADPTFRGLPRVAFSPDSQKVYITGHANGMVRFAVTGKTAEAVFQLPDNQPPEPNPWRRGSPAGRVSGVAVSADGSLVAVGMQTGELRVFPASGGRIALDVEFSGRVSAVAFSTDGRVIAVALADGSVHLVPVKS
jgi:serine/threonine protein kinase